MPSERSEGDGAGPSQLGPAPERAPAPGPGAAAVEWGRAQPGQAFLSGRGQAAPSPASSVCSDQIQVPLVLLFVPPEPRARRRLLPACGWPCAQCGQTRTLWGAGVPWGSGRQPRGRGPSRLLAAPGIILPTAAQPVCVLGPGLRSTSLTPPRPCGATWGCIPSDVHPWGGVELGSWGTPAAWRGPPCRVSGVLLGFCLPRRQAYCVRWRPCVHTALDGGPRGDGLREAPPPSGSLWLTTGAPGPAAQSGLRLHGVVVLT